MSETYFPAKCMGCGWTGSSELLDGGGAIADTGDYEDCTCPNCGSRNIEEDDDQ